MKKYFACSDIHSFFTEWQQALQNRGFNYTDPEHNIIICGDLFDRGPESLKCFEFVRDMAEQKRLIYVRGNHEDLLFDALHEIDKGRIGGHHWSNGTINTIAEFLDVTPYDVISKSFDWKSFDTLVNTSLLPFITKNTVDFFELGNTIFVHGWLPTWGDDSNVECVHADWRLGNWAEARWQNGMEMFKYGIVPENKTVVCGHWHTSYGHSQISGTCNEWGPTAYFGTFTCTANNCTIYALDACTVLSGFVNCIVFDENGGIIND